MIPLFYAKEILSIKETDSTEYVAFVESFAPHFVRIKGFYKTFPELEKDYEIMYFKKKGELKL